MTKTDPKNLLLGVNCYYIPGYQFRKFEEEDGFKDEKD